METHSGDTPFNRFLAYWMGILTCVGFGLAVAALMVLLRGCSPEETDYEQAQVERRTVAAAKARHAQSQAVGSEAWAENADGTVTVPVDVALPKLVGKLSARKPEESEVPVVPPTDTPSAAETPADTQPEAPPQGEAAEGANSDLTEDTTTNG